MTYVFSDSESQTLSHRLSVYWKNVPFSPRLIVPLLLLTHCFLLSLYDLFPSLAFTLLPSLGLHLCLFLLDSQASGSFLILWFEFSQDFRHESWEPCSQIQVPTRTRKLTQMTWCLFVVSTDVSNTAARVQFHLSQFWFCDWFIFFVDDMIIHLTNQ